jgi:DNA-damage-inducible protein J
MPTKLVQARVEESIKDQSAKVLERWGLTISDMVRILLTRTAREGSPPIELVSTSEEHDRWFKNQVLEAIEDDDFADSEQAKDQFERQRAQLKAKFR